LNPPYSFYPDANNDDVPDAIPVQLSGFGLEDTHSVANLLRWGLTAGFMARKAARSPRQPCAQHGRQTEDARPIFPGQRIWRYHPENGSTKSSPKAGQRVRCEIDSQGRIFSGHNGGDTRGFHYLQVRIFRKAL
jgi:hypothetical protein